MSPIGTSPSSLDELLAERLLTERQSRDWSVAELASRSGVSRAMISKIERGEAHPTSTVLGKLSGAFGLPLSTLLARAEAQSSRLARTAIQPVWRDPATGYIRRALSPSAEDSLQLTEIELPAGARVSYPAAAYTFIRQQIWALAGTLTFYEGDVVHRLQPGDCLALGTPADCTFENETRRVCRYLVAVVRQ